MAYSYNEYIGDGVTTDYLISFAGPTPGYLSEDHVHLYLNDVLQDDADREFVDDTHIRIIAPAAGTTIRFQRSSSIETPVVDWAGGAGVSSTNLDDNTLQMLYIAQEAYDLSADNNAIIGDFLAAVGSAETAATNAAASASEASDGADAASASAVLAAGYVSDVEALIDAIEDIGAPYVTFEVLDANGDVGTGADQVAAGNHTHTESDITDLGNYADATHTHTESDITDLGDYASTGKAIAMAMVFG